MCNCLKETQERFIGHLKDHSDILEGKVNLQFDEVESGYVNQFLSFGDTSGGFKLAFPFHLKYTYEKKDGSRSREQTIKTNVFPTYCPFCGEKMVEIDKMKALDPDPEEQNNHQQ